jgi:hypothetical protein
MNNDQAEKRNKEQNILMGDQSTSRFNWYYEDHITSIVRRAEKEGQFDEVKGKKIKFDSDLNYKPEKALNKVLKDNGVLPKWMELQKEIKGLKVDLEIFNDAANIKRTVDIINKKVMDHNLCCPRTSQLGGINLQNYLLKRGIS